MFSLSFQNVSNIPTASFLTQFFDQRLNKFRTLHRPRRRSCKFIKSYNFLLSKFKKKTMSLLKLHIFNEFPRFLIKSSELYTAHRSMESCQTMLKPEENALSTDNLGAINLHFTSTASYILDLAPSSSEDLFD